MGNIQISCPTSVKIYLAHVLAQVEQGFGDTFMVSVIFFYDPIHKFIYHNCEVVRAPDYRVRYVRLLNIVGDYIRHS